jgi:hypothetical protein
VEARLRAIEDRFRILDLLAGSALSSDIASEVYWQTMFAPGAEMDRGGAHGLESRAQIIDIIRSADQADAIARGMAHAMALPHIRIHGDRAVATGYLHVLVLDPASAEVQLPGKGARKPPVTYHLTVNRWEFERTGQEWQVVRRVVRPIGSEEAKGLLRRGIDTTD